MVPIDVSSNATALVSGNLIEGADGVTAQASIQITGSDDSAVFSSGSLSGCSSTGCIPSDGKDSRQVDSKRENMAPLTA